MSRPNKKRRLFARVIKNWAIPIATLGVAGSAVVYANKQKQNADIYKRQVAIYEKGINKLVSANDRGFNKIINEYQQK